MFDIDGTITRIDDIIHTVQEEFPDFKLEHYTDYDLKNSLVTNGFLGKSSKFSTGQFLRKYPLLFLDGVPRNHMGDYFNKIHRENHHIEFVTARYYTDERYNHTLDWSNKHFPNIQMCRSNLHFIDANAKHHHVIKALLDAKSTQTKTVVHFYEDKLETLFNTIEAYKRMNNLVDLEEFGELRLYLIETPYSPKQITEDIKVVKCWSELL